jgi:hypothetical protein
MQIETFWELIEKSKVNADDCTEQADNLSQLLSNLEPPEIVNFSEHFNQKLVDAFRWDLWAVAYIVNGGASDDGFLYFRGWLLAQGRDYFEAALSNPKNGANNAVVGEFNECEDILYVARQVYEELTGDELPTTLNEPAQPSGESWDEDDVEEMFPTLAEKFG